MNRHCKIKKTFSVNAEQFLENHKMSAAADRQKFRKSLYNAEQKRFPPFHNYFSSLFLKTFIMDIISMIIPQRITIGAANSLLKSNMA